MGNGPNYLNDKGVVRTVIEQHVPADYVPSAVSGGFYTRDMCVFAARPAGGETLPPLAQIGPRTPLDEITTGCGYGDPAFLDRPLMTSTGDVLAYYGEERSVAGLNVDDSLFNKFSMIPPYAPLKGRASNRDSGSVALNSRN